ncbi:MAG: ATP-binding protein [Desulfarculus sp.]|nr:ATP-binding protein [Desulfarculus sp.]
MKVNFVQTSNVKRLNGLVDMLLSAGNGEPRLGLFYGPAGRGKTRAVDTLATQTGACYVSAARVWTPSSMLKSVVRALGQVPAVSATENLGRAAEAMRERLGNESLGNGLLIIDEADYLAKGTQPPHTPPLLDTVRDLHDASTAPILLVGMDSLARTLSVFPQFWDRVLVAEEARELSRAEVVDLGRELAGLTLADEVAEDIRRATNGNLRQTILYLVRLERRAATQKVSLVARDWVSAVEAEISRSKLRAAQGGRGLKAVR